MLNILPEIVK